MSLLPFEGTKGAPFFSEASGPANPPRVLSRSCCAALRCAARGTAAPAPKPGAMLALTQTQTQTHVDTNTHATAGNIERLQVINFMNHANLEIDFNPGVNFIVGGNGSGKSAVLMALCFALVRTRCCALLLGAAPAAPRRQRATDAASPPHTARAPGRESQKHRPHRHGQHQRTCANRLRQGHSGGSPAQPRHGCIPAGRVRRQHRRGALHQRRGAPAWRCALQCARQQQPLGRAHVLHTIPFHSWRSAARVA